MIRRWQNWQTSIKVPAITMVAMVLLVAVPMGCTDPNGSAQKNAAQPNQRAASSGEYTSSSQYKFTLQPRSASRKTSNKPEREPTPDEVARMKDPNVLNVVCFYAVEPWMWNTERSTVIGIQVPAMYLLGKDSLGVFGDGVIRYQMYVDQNDRPGGDPDLKLFKEIKYTTEEAIPFRSKKRTGMGWGYALFMPCEELGQMGGKKIRLVVSFERLDGIVRNSETKDYRVPTKPSRW